MAEKHISDLLLDYLDNLLDDEVKIEVEVHLKDCAFCTEEFNNLRTLYAAFESEEVIVAPDKIRANFYGQLELEKQNYDKVLGLNNNDSLPENSWKINILKIAASIAILVGSFMFGEYLQMQKGNAKIATLTNESLELKQTAMLSLMENKSASKRIKGVNYIDDFSNPDKAIINALINRMLYDTNTNVRLTAVEALGKFVDSEDVKKAFIVALGVEKNPNIQIPLIHILVKIQEKNAVNPMEHLLMQEETETFVKEQIKLLLPTII